MARRVYHRGQYRDMTPEEEVARDAEEAAWPPPPPTAEQYAAQFDDIKASKERIELALRAVVSLLADQRGITDAQALKAVRDRMKAIAEGTRG